MSADQPIASQYGTRPGDESEAEPESLSDTFAAIRASGVFRGSQALAQAMFAAASVDTSPLTPYGEVCAERDAALARAEAAEKERDVLRDAVWHMMVTTTDDTQPQTDVDRVLDQLHRRVVGAPERTKLRGALDRADAPDKSRTGQDAAVGRALRVER